MSHVFQEAEDYLAARLRITPIYAFQGKVCSCGDTECHAAGKHPYKQGWQNTALADDGVMEIWQEMHKCNSLGWVLDEEHIVIDVDKRSGGLESLDKLQKDLSVDLFKECNAVVKTGGGGWHFYFKKLDSHNLGWKMPKQYPGIDIKQFGGYVIIAGSEHVSGNDYEWHSAAKSDLSGMSIIPEPLAKLLTKTYTTYREGLKATGEADLDEIASMLDKLDAGMPYETWLRVGMGVHNETGGSHAAFKVWDSWSQRSSKYEEGLTAKKWFSFGKYTGDPVGIATVAEMARDEGWIPASDTNVLTPDQLKELKESWAKKKADQIVVPSTINDADIDLGSPPGLLGDIYQYVYACSAYPNKTLALACSLSTLTNVIGRRYYWPGKFANIQPNMIIMCVAGSSVGKDSLIKAAHRILSIANLAPAIHGRIKSDKDLIDAMERNQYAMYYIDEFGYVLQRIANAVKNGNASYLEGITSTIMEAFTKGDGELLLDLARKASLREKYEGIINTSTTFVTEGKGRPEQMEKAKQRGERAKKLMKMHATGLPNPFLSIFTTATPRSMESAFSGDATENGFLSRAMAFHEFETNPRRKDDFNGTPPVPMGLEMKLRAVSVGSHLDACPFGRIDSFEMERIPLEIDHDAQVFVDRAIDYFHEVAEVQKESGLESLPRRALDSVVKVCIALAAQDGRLTLQMARYAVKLVRMEIDRKIRRVNSTERMASKDGDVRLDGVKERILEVCNTERGETPAVILNQVKSGRVNREKLDQVLDALVQIGRLEAIDQGRKYGGVQLFRYKTCAQQSE